MTLPASPEPASMPAGYATDYPWQPLAKCGYGNPFFYHVWSDDFDGLLGATGIYTVTKTGNGTVVHNAADGGTALFTTNSSVPAGSDLCSIQLPAASFTLPQGAGAGKKFFYNCRLQLSDVVNAAFAAGLMVTTTTPFTAPSDGLYFLKASGASNNLILRSSVGSVNTDTVIPTSAYSLANNTNVDFAFSIDRNGVVYAFIGAQLVGWVPQSGTGSSVPPRGPCVSNSGLTLTTAALNATLALQSGTASSKTMLADFHGFYKER